MAKDLTFILIVFLGLVGIYLGFRDGFNNFYVWICIALSFSLSNFFGGKR